MVLVVNGLTRTNCRCLTRANRTTRHQSRPYLPKTALRLSSVDIFVEAVAADGCQITCLAKLWTTILPTLKSYVHAAVRPDSESVARRASNWNSSQPF